MEDFIDEFKAEARSIMENVQQQLMLLDQDPKNAELVQEIFRGVHTLKGSSRMFGFESIEEITHELENSFDQVREGEIEATKGLINISFQVMDFIDKILNGKEDQQALEQLKSDLASKNFLVENKASHQGVFQILYYPSEDVYARGVNPMAALEELEEIGETKVFQLKGGKSLEDQEKAKKFESAYEVLLLLEKSQEDLDDVFLFMDDSEFTIREIKDVESATLDQLYLNAEKYVSKKLSEEQKEERKAILTEFIKSIQSDTLNQKVNQEIKEAEAIKEEKAQISTKDNSGMNYINVKQDRLDEMMNLVSELVNVKAALQYHSELSGDPGLENSVERLEKISNRFRDNAFSMRLVPLQLLSLKFQRMVRDLGTQLDKDINLITEGLDTEIDKTIIHEVEAPLMHIIRNAIDHGLETPEERKKANKPAKGLLKIVAFYAGANVFIQIQDDGKGLNLKRIREKAVEKKIIGAKQNLNENEIINLIFHPGFSTHETATEYSGRGVGMDVVQNKLKELRGSIEVTTEKGLGTAFTLRLPLSLSILDVLHVKVGEINYLLPHNEVEQCFSERLNQEVIQKRSHNLKYKGKLLPHLNLGELFEEEKISEEERSIIVMEKNDQLVSLEVDEIISEQQLVIKPVDEALQSLDYLSGVAVLGNGELAFLLDSLKLKERFAKESKNAKQQV